LNIYGICKTCPQSFPITVAVTDNTGITYSEDIPIFIDNVAEVINNAPTDLSSGITLNTNGGNNAYLEADAGSVFGGLESLAVEISFSTSNPKNATIVSYVSGASEELELSFQGLGQLEIEVGNSLIISTGTDYTTLVDGQLHSLAFNWDNTLGDWSVYIDGTLVDSGTGLNAGHTILGGGNLVLGQNNGSAGIDTSIRNFEGTYHDLRVWNTTRSESEIAINHQNKFDSHTLPTDLVANWQMSGFNSSNQIVDVVNANHLTLKHAMFAGFEPNTPTDFLNINENSLNGASVGFVVPAVNDHVGDLINDGSFASAATGVLIQSGNLIGGPSGHYGNRDPH